VATRMSSRTTHIKFRTPQNSPTQEAGTGGSTKWFHVRHPLFASEVAKLWGSAVENKIGVKR